MLSRQCNERIIIGDEIAVQVIEIRGDQVRLGITAPSNVSVHREEVYDAIKRVYPPPADAACHVTGNERGGR